MKGVIIVVGGSAERALLIQKALEPHHYATVHCRAIAEFNSVIGDRSALLVIILYPDELGIIAELYNSNTVAAAHGMVPVIFISSSRDHNESARSLHYNADEFLIEPISSSELVTVVDQVVEMFAQTSTQSLIRSGDLTLDRTTLTVSLRNATLSIRPIDARILAFLMLKPGRARTRREISNAVWGPNSAVDDRTIDVFVGRIRDAVKHKVSVDPIRTIRNVGYAFNDEFAKIESRPKKGRVMRPGF